MASVLPSVFRKARSNRLVPIVTILRSRIDDEERPTAVSLALISDTDASNDTAVKSSDEYPDDRGNDPNVRRLLIELR
jgi:hypothetical protein